MSVSLPVCVGLNLLAAQPAHMALAACAPVVKQALFREQQHCLLL